jgi:hypothetical protein
MLICMTAPPGDPAAEELAERFRKDGFCPFGANGVHMGFVRSVDRNEGGYFITVEITEPELEEHFRAMTGGE